MTAFNFFMLRCVFDSLSLRHLKRQHEEVDSRPLRSLFGRDKPFREGGNYRHLAGLCSSRETAPKEHESREKKCGTARQDVTQPPLQIRMKSFVPTPNDEALAAFLLNISSTSTPCRLRVVGRPFLAQARHGLWNWTTVSVFEH